MDFPINSSLNSSLVLALAVALWLLWVGPYFFRRPTTSAAQTAEPSAERPAAAAGPSTANAIHPPASPDKGSQGIIMNNISNAPSGGGSTQFHVPLQPTARPGQPAPAFRIRTGRTALAAAGLLAVLAVVGGTLLAMVTSVSWLLPAAGLGAMAAVVAMLRSLAVRDRRRRVDNAFRAAMGPEPRPAQDRSGLPEGSPVQAADEVPAEPQRETVLFDRESATVTDNAVAAAAPAPAPAPDPAPTRPTVGELRAEAAKAAAGVHVPPRPNTTPWQPVELPKPVYVDAPKAERPAPEPIVVPETPKSLTKTPLRPSAAPGRSQQARPETGKINLDDVLQRRRA